MIFFSIFCYVILLLLYFMLHYIYLTIKAVVGPRATDAVIINVCELLAVLSKTHFT